VIGSLDRWRNGLADEQRQTKQLRALSIGCLRMLARFNNPSSSVDSQPMRCLRRYFLLPNVKALPVKNSGCNSCSVFCEGSGLLEHAKDARFLQEGSKNEIKPGVSDEGGVSAFSALVAP
jgi:hypothetical protein